MNYLGHCKICGITLEVSAPDDYPGNDIKALVSMLTCDRCYDLRDRFLRIVAFIEDRVSVLHFTPVDEEAVRGRVRKHLTVALEKMAVVLAEVYRSRNWVTREDVDKTVGILMDHPKTISDTLYHFRALCRQRSQTTQTAYAPESASLPYHDS